MPAEEYDAALVERREAAHERLNEFEAFAAPLIEAVAACGGTMQGYAPSSGWISARIPAAAVDSLATRDDVGRIELDIGLADGADPVTLKTLKSLSGSKGYSIAGYRGSACGPLCAPLILGIHESNGHEDEACFQGSSSCTPLQRLRSRFNCTAAGCSFLSGGFAGTQEGEHGTIVASIAFGSYTNGQAAGLESFIAPGLSNWEADATGFATEAHLDYYRVGAVGSTGAWKAYECARGEAAAPCDIIDVMNQSSGDTTGRCSASSWLAIENEVEDAWDSGILPIVITHNDNAYPGSDVCRIRSPADLPKAFAVGAVDASFSAPYHTWDYAAYSNRGGGTTTIGGHNHVEAMSMVDLVAAGGPGFITDDDDSYGTLQPSGHPAGGATSFAAPQVAGAALQVKDRHIALGQSWIGHPGRLHAVMLSMGDRATQVGASGATAPSCVVGTHVRCGADRYFGLGRLTLRMHPQNWQISLLHTAFTASVSRYVAWQNPLSATRRLVKCVVQQAEDMVGPNKSDISRIGITVQIRDPDTSGNCVLNVGQVNYSISDDLPDDKHMVAVTDSDVSLAGQCVQVNFSKWALSSAGLVVTHAYCVADDVLDTE